MTKTLLSPAQVVRAAFTPEEGISPAAVTEADIAAAEQRYIVPVVGRALYEKIQNGAYPDFAAAYLAPAVALFTRVVIQPRLDIHTGRAGTTSPRSSYAQPSDADALRRLLRTLRGEARTLLRRASEHLAAHRTDYPEYDPETDIFNCCSTDGNLVQIR